MNVLSVFGGSELIVGDGSPQWSDYIYATGLYVRSLRSAGWSRERVRDLLDKMVENELSYRKKNGLSAP